MGFGIRSHCCLSPHRSDDPNVKKGGNINLLCQQEIHLQVKNFHCSFRLPADSFLIPSLNFRVQENSFRTNLRMSMLRRWRWISGAIPVAYPPPGIWQGRNGKWLGQKYAAFKASLPTLQFAGSMCLFSWVCKDKFLGTHLHATHMIHYQARCALTRPKVKIDRDGKEVTLRPKHLVLATGLPLGFGKASALEVLKDWGHQGPKKCCLGLVFVAS